MSDSRREQLIQDLRASQQQVVDALAATQRIQDWQREQLEWSFRDLAAHLAAVEKQCHLRRIQRIASGKEPQLNGYTVQVHDDEPDDISESLRQWMANREELILYVEQLEDQQLEYVGNHDKIGAITVLDALQEMLDQDLGNFRHVCQLILDYYEDHNGSSVPLLVLEP